MYAELIHIDKLSSHYNTRLSSCPIERQIVHNSSSHICMCIPSDEDPRSISAESNRPGFAMKVKVYAARTRILANAPKTFVDGR